MLNIEEILKMSEEMGITVEDGTSGKHYILDNSGKEIEFSVDMLMLYQKEDAELNVDSCFTCSKYKNNKCTRIGTNNQIGVCWMEKSEGEY